MNFGAGYGVMSAATNSASIVVRSIAGNVVTGGIWTAIDLVNNTAIMPIMVRALSGVGFAGQLITTTFRNMVQVAKINVWNQLGNK